MSIKLMPAITLLQEIAYLTNLPYYSPDVLNDYSKASEDIPETLLSFVKYNKEEQDYEHENSVVKKKGFKKCFIIDKS